ncbi:MAG TPA: DUF2284 domain-containing protein [Bacillota bacterium]|nr:DUF2284 domain-containing protein [Bacillota bacterium]
MSTGMCGQDIIKQLADEIVAEGASRARILTSSQVVIDPRVRLKCQVPSCDSYNFNLQCPPNCLSVNDFANYLACYQQVILVQLEAELTNADTVEAHYDPTEVYKPANQLHQLINWAESRAFALGFRFACGFIGGCCRLCPVCVGPKGEKCRHPFKARPSMEAVGIDVFATSQAAGIPIEFPVRDKVVWCGMLLVE